MPASSRAPIPTYPTDGVLAAACASYRITEGNYRKADNREGLRSSKDITWDRMTDGDITAEDRAMAAEVRRWWSALVVTSLARTLSPMERDGMAIADSQDIPHGRLGLAAWLPHGWAQAVRREAVEDTVYQEGRRWIAAPGDRVDLAVRILESKWSQQWGRHFYRAVVEGGGVIRFGAAFPLEVGGTVRIRGTVTAHEGDGVVKVTRLNRVKAVG